MSWSRYLFDINPSPYSDLNDVLIQLVSEIEEVSQDNLVGFYLQGSFALGDFDDYSDVDFVVAIGDELTEKQITALQNIHKRIYTLLSPWAQHLEGSYFPLTVLKDYRQSGSELWYLDNGHDTLVRSSHCNTALVRWVVRHKGITLLGPSPSMLVDPIPIKALKAEIFQVMHDWGKDIRSHPEIYNNRFYQGFIVLSYCRMLHDFIYGEPSSKKTGAEWAKQNLDTSWQGLIDRSWATRPVPENSVRTPPNKKDFRDTLNFVEYILNESMKHQHKH